MKTRTPATPVWLLPMAAAIATARSLVDGTEQILRDFSGGSEASRQSIEWVTPNNVVREFSTMRLRDFSIGPRAGVPVLIEAPFAIHDAGIINIAEGHSLVAAFLKHDRRGVFVTDWKSGTPALSGLSIDSYISDLNAAVDAVGGVVDLVGICQGGWMALLYAATCPGKIRRLTLAGAPIDTDAAHSTLVAAARSTPRAWIENMINAGNGVVLTDMVFSGLLDLCATTREARAALQIAGAEETASDDAVARFLRWNRRNLVLPGRYFLEVFDWIFRENRIAGGDFPVFGSPAELRRVTIPLFVLAGDRDDFAPAAQSLAAIDFVGTPRGKSHARIVPDCGHLDLFMGARVLRDEWPKVIAFLNAND